VFGVQDTIGGHGTVVPLQRYQLYRSTGVIGSIDQPAYEEWTLALARSYKQGTECGRASRSGFSTPPDLDLQNRGFSDDPGLGQ
jgi:hypothetical protein